MPTLLIVCRANLFRSPLAAACLRRVLQERASGESWRVESAGTWTRTGWPAHPLAQKAARRLGLSLAGHRSKPIDREQLRRADLILVMEASQREALEVEFPEVEGKVFLLTEAAGWPPFDIPDPLASEEDPFQIAREICQYIRQGIDRIRRLAQKDA